ncbi:MAG TPA: SpoIIE family protein phosphatase [Terriglobales bacterium]|jgi:sigma-B regulation protein RsbU (phosphoserine phosphatase)|nr:SpoIIE family protein phosphatase [Terriglobales bacterium]
MQKTTTPRAIKPPLIQYVLLAIICVMAVLYHVRLAQDILHGERVNVPFLLPQAASAALAYAAPGAVGLHSGDILVAINGRPYTGTAVLVEESAKTQPGTSLAITVRSPGPGAPGERTVQVPVTWGKPRAAFLGIDVVVGFVMPIFCLLLGIWVAAARPRDPLAWLLLALMLSLPQVFELATIAGWGPGIRELAMAYHAVLAGAWPIFMYLFGLYFPEPFPPAPRWSFRNLVWKIWLWIGVVPLAIFGLAGGTIVRIGEMTNYQLVAPIYHLALPIGPYLQVMAYILVTIFFVAIGAKSSLAISADAKRRLRLLYLGSALAMTPALLATIITVIEKKAQSDIFSGWLLVFIVTMLALFPLTLAYVIVVQRAMDVRMVLRQGLQYALAKTGLRVLQMAGTLMIAIVIYLITRKNQNQTMTSIALSVIAFFAIRRIRRVGEKLRLWLDRRFFREAYNAEQILTELSEQVRSMLEPRSLLEKVATQIAETLHVRNIAVLLSGSEIYQPAYALGFPSIPQVAFLASTATVKHMRENREPARIYLEDHSSWIYSEPQATEEERGKLAELGSELLLPLLVRDKLLGFISLGPKRSEEPYSGNDVRLLKSVAAQTGLALENANLMQTIADEVAQRERMNREVEIAREVQERLFPQKLPAIKGLDYAGHCRPALGVGGDYYDFLSLPEGHLGVAIGDVSGKGIAAALMMASLQASLRGEAARAPKDLAAVIANINRLVYETSSAHRYATFFYGQYDPVTHRFDYVNAGHNPPLLLRSWNEKWEISRLDVGGTVVGLLESFPYQQGQVTLAPDDVLVAFTDGISEAMNSNEEEWGEKNLIATIECNSNSKLPAAELLKCILQAADAFVAGAQQHDDMTLVVLRVLR